MPARSTWTDWCTGLPVRHPLLLARGGSAYIIWLEHFLSSWRYTWEPDVSHEAAW